MSPHHSALQVPYNAYQALVAAQWADTWPTPPVQTLPAEIRHIQRARPVRRSTDTPDLDVIKDNIDYDITDVRILAAAGDMALELIERARWLTHYSQDVRQRETPEGRHGIEATLPLAIPGDDYVDATARVSLRGTYRHVFRTSTNAVHLDHVGVEIYGRHAGTGRPFWTHASVGSAILNLAQPRTANHTTKILYGPSLVEGFELRDMLTSAENWAPDSRLPQQPYPTHIAHDPVAVSPEYIADYA